MPNIGTKWNQYRPPFDMLPTQSLQLGTQCLTLISQDRFQNPTAKELGTGLRKDADVTPAAAQLPLAHPRPTRFGQAFDIQNSDG